MYLICNVCHPRPDNGQLNGSGVLCIAKWYPAGGFIAGQDGSYYTNDNFESLPEKLNAFLIQHQHQAVASEHYEAGEGQENPVRLEYESVGLPLRSGEGDCEAISKSTQTTEQIAVALDLAVKKS